MANKSHTLDLVIGAVMRLDALSGERANTIAFIQSCYCGLVRSYDFNAALAALAKLTDEEQHALIAWVVMQDEAREAARSTRRL